MSDGLATDRRVCVELRGSWPLVDGMQRATVHVQGVVQSVGFRPFVYREAVERDLRGSVRNLGDAGVEIELEGPADRIDAFLERLRADPPPLAWVESVAVDRWSADGDAFDAFRIVESADARSGGGTIPPDTAVCDACVEDMRDPDSRFYGYWATACVDCGPRFTVIESLPYDRQTTSMAAFPMCADCRADYEAPTDRRYHAQAIACPACGPSLAYGTAPADPERATAETDRDPFPAGFETDLTGRAAVGRAARALRAGRIVVVKGLGGAHLACDATDASAVDRLRDRTGRPTKPFAVMVPDLGGAEEFAIVSVDERADLTSPRRPILLLDRRDDAPVARSVAPGLSTVGVMLPYTGVHHLLFDELDVPLVVTSANRPGQPMLVENAAILEELAEVADGFLLHDRRIVARCDDAVARFVAGRRQLLRRSRGFVPTPVPLCGPDAHVLALGPELDATAAVLDGGDCYLTQHVGDVDDVATESFLEDAIEQLLDVTGLEHPPVVAHDRHPSFITTALAERLEATGRVEDRLPVQHHHAHAASVLAEHDRDAAVAITADGVGYGPDGTVWGGEVLDATRSDFDRVGSLVPVPMPGGDRATRHPGRLAAGLLYAHDPDVVERVLTELGVGFPNGAEERDAVVQQLDADVNTPRTSSAGRFLDAVAALLDVCDERTYEGEPAMRLEAVAARGDARPMELPFTDAPGYRALDSPALFARLVEQAEAGVDREAVAATAQAAIARGFTELAVEAAAGRGRDAIALTGGVAFNGAIASAVRDGVEAAGLTLLRNDRVPPGDGGIAYGQAAVAAARLAGTDQPFSSPAP